MKLSVKRMLSALFVGVLLATPVAGPFQLAAGALNDQEMEELRKELQASGNTTPRLSGEQENIPRWRQGTTAGSGASGAAATTKAAAVTNDFETSTRVDAKTLMASAKSYAAKNDKVVGWLYVPNTNINEPIVLDSSQGNAYYETRTWDGTNYPDNNWTNYRITATFADRRTVIKDSWRSTSRNIVLYGHNWTNLRNPLDIGNVPQHVMFGQLPSYTNQQFAQNNPYIYFSTPENEGIWKVFAAFYCEESTAFNYNSPNPAEDVFAANLTEFKNRSIYDFGTDVDATDRMLTLSTCTRVYGDHSAQRFVVMARLLRDGESDADAVSVTVNADMKKPLL